MIVTIKADITWDGKLAETINGQSEKKFKAFLKDLTGATDVEVNDWSVWEEDDADYKPDNDR